MRTQLRVARAALAGAAVALPVTGSRSAEAMFTSEPGEGGFTIQAPRLPGWTQQPIEGPSAGIVLHRFDPPTEDSDMGTATITLTAFSPVDSADAALTNLRTLRANGTGWQESSRESIEICGRQGLRVSGVDRTAGVDLGHDYLESPYESAGLIFPIQIRSQLKATDATRYETEVRTIIDGVRIVP